ncbi:unnamed protein product [Microthlaspi erraticum]|uniref:RNA polymerase Rpb5 N-terminal domain-containing protein n=1 Tax=Microthlaspi erraticum TaxID=1685480 RepID=A0A6D2LFT6_9BRAS|nr:unnamed protein product [Microthlaspi erraticum]
MSLSEEEIRRFFRIHKTLHQMLNDRGYIVTESETGMTHEQFVDKYGEDMKREDLVTLKIKRNDDSDKLIVFFPGETKIGIKQLRPYIARMESEKIFRAIFVIKQDFTPFALESLKTTSSKIHLEIFKVRSSFF